MNAQGHLQARLQRPVSFVERRRCRRYRRDDGSAPGVGLARHGHDADTGTGIGTALFVDGKLVPNTELGHLEIKGKEAEHRASAKVRTDRNLDWVE